MLWKDPVRSQPGQWWTPFSNALSKFLLNPTFQNGVTLNTDLLTVDSNHNLLQTTTTATGQQKPWNMPWGRVFRQTLTTNPNTTTTNVDLTNLTTGSFTPVDNRNYLIMGSILVASTVPDSFVGLRVLVDGVSIKNTSVFHNTTAGIDHNVFASYETTGAPVTIKLNIQRIIGTGTLSTAQSASNPGELLVMDMGPSGTPS